nr:glycoside hydrolase family 38 C-terminal domain-containing protein [Candidatus Brocadiia bacterium]
DAALRDFTVILDLAAPPEKRAAMIRQCRERLRPALSCVNGTCAPEFFCFGHAHLDVGWLWPIQESERKIARTLSNTLALIKEYPEYVYLQSQPQLFWMLKRRYPDMYAKVRELVKQGRIAADGGMWVEADTNITSGESLIRQLIHGKRFFRDEFGVESEVMWLPDVFGYSGALPQILRGCRVKYFSTQKIFWTYNGADPFPYAQFTWQGIDGSEVLAHLHMDYNSHTDPLTLCQRWMKRPQKDGYGTWMLPFGHGDGGGGPEREHLEFLRRCRDLQDVPRTRMASPAAFFADLEKRGTADARYVGELFFQCHRGVQTSQARTKRGNRKSEIALREAEMWGVAAHALNGRPFPLAQADAMWKEVLLNQFHDILPGSSIARVYEEAEAAYERVIRDANALAADARRALVRKDQASATVFNSLSWPRRALVALPSGMDSALDAAGRPLAVQKIEGTTWAEVETPACGWTTIRRGQAPTQAQPSVTARPGLLENEHLRVELNDRGEIASLFDKDAGAEMAAAPCNALAMFRDTPVAYDAWDIDTSYKRMPVDLPQRASVEVAASGPLAGILRVRRKISQSLLTQDIVLRRGSRRVEFRTVIDWRETQKLLKARFPVKIHADHAVHEIQFGHIQRPNHASRPFDADRFEVPQQKWTALVEASRGVAVLNDCKYGVNVDANSINLTLLRAPVAPDKHADQGRQEFTYAVYLWNGAFAQSGVTREAYDLNIPVALEPGDGGQERLFDVGGQAVILDTVKPAEDGSGDFVARLYESLGGACRCRLKTWLPAASAQLTDMLEENGRDVELEDGVATLDFRPFEIKTVRYRRP